MGDFIELGLEGCDKLIDKHFDKLPNHYVDPNTYTHPQRSRRERKDTVQSQGRGQGQGQERKQQRRGQSAGDQRDYYDQQPNRHTRSPSPPSPFSEYPPRARARESETMAHNGRPRGDANSSVYLQDGPYISPPFSTMPPVHRPEYSPERVDARDRDYYAPSSGGRPSQQMRRRSSSYHGPRQSERFYSSDEDDSADERSRRSGRNNQLATRERGSSRGKGGERSEKHHLKDEVSNQFTKSKEGIAGGALGALVAGWATHKALESKGRGKSEADKAWTLLGAAVGGLAVNSIVDKLEDRKEEQRNERRGEEKSRHGGSDRGRDGRSRREYDSEEEERRYYR